MEKKETPIFGQVYKTYIMHVFSIYEEIANSDMPKDVKKIEFETRLADYLARNKSETTNYLFQQTTDKRLILLAAKELQRGSESLNFETVTNLYNTFITDVNTVSNDYEGKMYSTVANNQYIFEEPILDENNNVQINKDIQYNFDMIKETYDFAKKHGKQIKFHTFLWHNAIPENLKSEIDAVENPTLKRKMALAFLQDYASHLSTFMKENKYDLRQLEALNEIANDYPGQDDLRSSWWKDVIGDNPENGDAYFIDVLKIVRENFPDTELIYNEYNEFLDHKTNKIVNIIDQVKSVEQRDGITLLDGIGLQAHYMDYVEGPDFPITIKDIQRSALKLKNACGDKKMYITEYDFLDIQKNGSKEELEQAFIQTYSKVANGFIMWGNSDSLTWYRCIDKDGSLIYTDGNPKPHYKEAKEAFLGKRLDFPYTVEVPQTPLNTRI